MRLNGWQRLWVLLSLPWSLGWCVSGLFMAIDGDNDAIAAILLAIAPIPAYLIGEGVAWVRRGFRK
jgi:hypothetical protein